jgi:hypothetical protein
MKFQIKKQQTLKHLQEQRAKASKKRKPEWQKKIDKHFFGK